jgi:Galactose oxidase, central domain
MYVLGGRASVTETQANGEGGGGGGALLDDAWQLDVSNGRWEQVKSRGRAPAARAYHSAVVRGDCMLVFGGLSAASSRFAHGDVHEYNFVSGV